jgi:hypothetical protein
MQPFSHAFIGISKVKIHAAQKYFRTSQQGSCEAFSATTLQRRGTHGLIESTWSLICGFNRTQTPSPSFSENLFIFFPVFLLFFNEEKKIPMKSYTVKPKSELLCSQFCALPLRRSAMLAATSGTSVVLLRIQSTADFSKDRCNRVSWVGARTRVSPDMSRSPQIWRERQKHSSVPGFRGFFNAPLPQA